MSLWCVTHGPLLVVGMVCARDDPLLKVLIVGMICVDSLLVVSMDCGGLLLVARMICADPLLVAHVPDLHRFTVDCPARMGCVDPLLSVPA